LIFTPDLAKLAAKTLVRSAKQDIQGLSEQYGTAARYTQQNKLMIANSTIQYLKRLK